MRFDLIIIGGGMVGMALALALRETELQLALIDAKELHPADPRLFALSDGSSVFLKKLGLWPLLEAHATAIRQVHVSRQGHLGTVRLRCEEVDLPALGYMVPAQCIESTLNAALLTQTNVTLYRPATLQALQPSDQQVHLTVANEKGVMALNAPIVVGADGAESMVRHLLHLDTQIVDDQQSALVTRTRLQREHQHVAYERFSSQGVIAMLPLKEQECATIWSAPSETIRQLQTLADVDFLQALQQVFGYRLGRLQAIGPRHVFPIKLIRAKQRQKQSVFLLGNAAHTLPPIAAQGLNLALYEVAVFVQWVQKKQSLTEEDWHEINQAIQPQQAWSTGLSHGLARYLTAHSLILNQAISLGMMGFNTLAPLKRTFIKSVLGYGFRRSAGVEVRRI